MQKLLPETCREDESWNHEDYIKTLFTNTKSVELPEDAPRIDKLEREVSELRVQCAELKDSVAYTEKWIEDWFRRHLSGLADYAAKEFVQRRDLEVMLTALEKAELHKHIQQAVEATFEREQKEFGQAIFNAIRNTIQPYALR